jgi:hypothetical protein
LLRRRRVDALASNRDLMGQILNTGLLVFLPTSLELLAQGRKLSALIVDCCESLLCGFSLSLHLDFGGTDDSIVADAEKLGPCLERDTNLGGSGRYRAVDRRRNDRDARVHRSVETRTYLKIA